MNHKFIYLLNFIFIIFFSSCGKLFIEPDPSGDAEKNFQIFWSDLYNTYPYFERDKVNWKKMYDDNHEKINSGSSINDLFDIMKVMLRPLQDGHISVTHPTTGEVWSNEKYENYVYENFYSIFGNYDGALKNYISSPVQDIYSSGLDSEAGEEVVASYAIINNNILYFHIKTYATEHPFENSITEILNINPEIKGIILDVRDNGGGRIGTMLNFMGVFFPRSLNYAYFKEKIGPLENDFSTPVQYTISPDRNLPYISHPIALLTNRLTFSAGEHTALAMKMRENTAIVGDTTGGGLSFLVQRTLPNGIQYITVSSQTFSRNNEIFEGTGIPPGISAEITEASYMAGKDDMLEKGIEFLISKGL